MDESENQEEGPLGRHSGHTARNGLASATLPVRVVTALSVNAPNPALLLPPLHLPSFLPSFHVLVYIARLVHPRSFLFFLLHSHPYSPFYFHSSFLLCVYNIYTLYTLCHFVTSRSNRCHSARIIFVAPPPSTRLLIDVTLRGTTRTSYLLSYFPHPTTSPLLPPPSLGPNE